MLLLCHFLEGDKGYSFEDRFVILMSMRQWYNLKDSLRASCGTMFFTLVVGDRSSMSTEHAIDLIQNSLDKFLDLIIVLAMFMMLWLFLPPTPLCFGVYHIVNSLLMPRCLQKYAIFVSHIRYLHLIWALQCISHFVFQLEPWILWILRKFHICS